MSTDGSAIAEPADVERTKRKNRWGSPAANTDGSNQDLAKDSINSVVDSSDAADNKKSRRSRWGLDAEPAQSLPSESSALAAQISNHIAGILPKLSSIGQPFSLGGSINTPAPELNQATVQQNMILKLQLSEVNQKLVTVDEDAKRIEQDPNRSPSPPPKYDYQGKRTNRREVRMREALNKERIRILEEMLKLNPTFRAPPDFLRGKPTNRVPIPKQTDPDYNYIGLIIGPRGNTQKQMEQETKCKISIRGKGSAKEGSKGRSNKNADDDEELHVHIQGEDQESVDKATKLIEALLNPNDEALNDHKQKQLRELALINGTLREDEFCPVCGERGHRQFECPHRAKTFKAAGVKCAICGDLSHPTRDCPLKQEEVGNQKVLDSEYDNFLAELGGAPVKQKAGDGSSASDASEERTDLSDKNVGNHVKSFSGPTILAPIIDMMATSRQSAVSTVAPPKPQTIIHVSTVMTGTSPPPFLSTSNFASASSSCIAGVATAPNAGYQPTQYNYPGSHGQTEYPGSSAYFGAGASSGFAAEHAQQPRYYSGESSSTGLLPTTSSLVPTTTIAPPPPPPPPLQPPPPPPPAF